MLGDYSCISVVRRKNQSSDMGSALAVAMVVGLASAVPRYITIPLADIEVINMSMQDRIGFRAPRAASPGGEHKDGELEKDRAGAWDQQPQQDGRVERQAGGGGHHHEHVDYGAHTGHHGAFGWYADFPVITHH